MVDEVRAPAGGGGTAASPHTATPTKAAPGPPTGTPSQESFAKAYAGAFEALLKGGADVVAKAVGLWTAARAAVSTVATGIAAAAAQHAVNEANRKYQDVPVTPAALADMVVRNIVSADWAANEASYSGLDAHRFSLLALDTGESYGIIDALRMWNRGTYMAALVANPGPAGTFPLYVAGENLARTYGINDKELETVIHYSRVRDEFIPDLKKLAKNTLSPADAVELVVKQIVSLDVGRSLFEAAGGVGGQFDVLVEGAGDSLGVVKAAEMHRLGWITDAQLTEVLGLSRMNPRFYPLVPLLAKKVLPPYELRQAVLNGTMPVGDAIAQLEAQGYSSADSKLYIDAIEMGSIGTAKAETAAMVLADWEAGLVTEAQATEALTNLGEKPWAIPFILDTVYAKKVITQRNAVVTRVRAAVLYGDVTPSAAQGYLLEMGWPAAAAAETVQGWVIESETPHSLLSTAEVGKLAEDGLVNAAWAVAYWQRRGYTAADANLLLNIYPPASKAAPDYVGDIDVLLAHMPRVGDKVTGELVSLLSDLEGAASSVYADLSPAVAGEMTSLEQMALAVGHVLTLAEVTTIGNLAAATREALAAHPPPVPPPAYAPPPVGQVAPLPPLPATIAVEQLGPAK